MTRRTIVVMAKSPVAGRVKTRLCPPCTPAQAAMLAEAALRDTLTAVVEADADRRLLALDGPVGPWLPAGFDVVAQRGAGLAQRLTHAVSQVPDGPLVVIGMDTPQVTSALLHTGFAALRDADAALGPATDGGWWALALCNAHPQLFAGVPMSAADTGARQLQQLRFLGLRTAELPTLTDVDRYADALAVAAAVPDSHFARSVSSLAGAAVPA